MGRRLPGASFVRPAGADGVTLARRGRTNMPLSGPERPERASSPLEAHLLTSLRAAGLPEPVREHLFAASIGRRWRVDFAWVAAKLAVEVEGGIYRGGGHTTVNGLKRDMAKGNALTLLGWALIRVHGDQVKSGEATELIRQALEMFSKEDRA